MKSRIVLPAIVALMVFALLSGPTLAMADDATVSKIAVCDTVKVLNTIQETKDVMLKWKQDADDLNKQLELKKSELQTMTRERDMLLPTSPQYAEKNDALTTATADDQAWAQSSQLILSRKQKEEQKELFAKVVSAVSEVAQAKNVAVVLNSSHPDFPDPDHMDANAFYQVILMHNCLYANASLDVTQDVILAMDKAYNSSH